ncbi:MAG: hypothetical protein ACI97P_002684 [Arcticibacterium sp.]|jgi:hypothetical protein
MLIRELNKYHITGGFALISYHKTLLSERLRMLLKISAFFNIVCNFSNWSYPNGLRFI